MTLDQWVTGPVGCRACGARHVAVAPLPEPGLASLECPRCGAMACFGVLAADAELWRLSSRMRRRYIVAGWNWLYGRVAFGRAGKSLEN